MINSTTVPKPLSSVRRNLQQTTLWWTLFSAHVAVRVVGVQMMNSTQIWTSLQHRTVIQLFPGHGYQKLHKSVHLNHGRKRSNCVRMFNIQRAEHHSVQCIQVKCVGKNITFFSHLSTRERSAEIFERKQSNDWCKTRHTNTQLACDR